MSQTQSYRRMGGWLMFINVMAIIFIVSYSLSLLGSIFYSFWLGMFGSAVGSYTYSGYDEWWRFYDQIMGYANFSGIFTLIVSILSLAAVICVLIFLNKRNLLYFKISFFAGFGVSAISSVVLIAYYAFNPIGRIFQGIFDDYSYYTGDYYSGYPSFYAMSDYMNRFLIIMMVVGLLVTIGLAIAWFFYFKRSQRVAVYFDPNYVEPAPLYQAPSYPSYPVPAVPAYAQPIQYGQAAPHPAYRQPAYTAPPGGAYPPPARPVPYVPVSQPYGGRPQVSANPYGVTAPQQTQSAPRPDPASYRSAEAAFIQNIPAADVGSAVTDEPQS